MDDLGGAAGAAATLNRGLRWRGGDAVGSGISEEEKEKTNKEKEKEKEKN
jgi:phage baseplate assembly protein gpV